MESFQIASPDTQEIEIESTGLIEKTDSLQVVTHDDYLFVVITRCVRAQDFPGRMRGC